MYSNRDRQLCQNRKGTFTYDAGEFFGFLKTILPRFAGEFVLSKPQIRINQGTRRQYSVNESYSASWDRRVLDFVNSKKQGDAPIAQR